MNLAKKIKCKLGLHKYEFYHNNPIVDYYKFQEIKWLLSGFSKDRDSSIGPLKIGIKCVNCTQLMKILVENLEEWEIIKLDGEVKLICKKLRSGTDHENDDKLSKDGKAEG